MSRKSRKPVTPEGYASIEEATVLLGFKHSQYTRRLLLEGDPEKGTGLWGKKVAFKGFSKWFISLDSIEKYLESHRREAKGRRFILNTALENEGAVRKVLDTLGIEYTLALSYKPKED